MGVSESNLRCILLCTPLNPGCHGSLGTFKTDRQHLTSGITSWHYWAAANASVTFFPSRTWLSTGSDWGWASCDAACAEALKRKIGVAILDKGKGRRGQRQKSRNILAWSRREQCQAVADEPVPGNAEISAFIPSWSMDGADQGKGIPQAIPEHGALVSIIHEPFPKATWVQLLHYGE